MSQDPPDPQYPVHPDQPPQYPAQPGYQQQNPAQPGYQPQPVNFSQQRPTNGFAVASLILAIFGICVGIIPLFIGLFLSFIPCVLGIVFGIVGLNRAKKIGGYGFGLALAGLIIASLNFLLYFTGYGIIW